jgi:Fe-S cluster assembly ATPase SufC
VLSPDTIVPSRFVIARDPNRHNLLVFITADPERLSVMIDTKVVMDYGNEVVQKLKDMTLANATEEAEDKRFARE